MNHPNLTILDHPLIQHKMTFLRNVSTGTREFRQVTSEISTLICYEATRGLPLENTKVQTPKGIANTKQLAGRKLAFVPILRAGLGMVDGALMLVPSAKVGHVGLYRDHKTLKPVEYFCKLPSDIDKRDVIVLDPMVATGGSAADTISMIKEKGAQNIKLMCICAAPDGIQAVLEAHPDVHIFCAALDEGLDENGYIVPGLGDAGDRIFGTL